MMSEPMYCVRNSIVRFQYEELCVINIGVSALLSNDAEIHQIIFQEDLLVLDQVSLEGR